MKICLITDTHLGIRNNSEKMLDIQNKFYNEVFFPNIDKHKISTIVHLGDYFDNRKNVSHLSLESNYNSFIKPFLERNLKMYIIAGNHDCYYFNTNRLNSLQTILSKYSNIEIIDNKMSKISLDNGKTHSLLVPWLNDENFEEFFEYPNKSEIAHVFGHFDINGFEMHTNQVAEHGLESELFEGFPLIFSGHFHKKSHAKNIHYLGSPWQATWSDYGDERGFHIFDTESNHLQFIENPNKIFHVIKYNNGCKDKLFTFKDKYVKIIIEKKDNEIDFNNFLKDLNSFNPINVTIVDNHNINLIESTVEVDETKTTLEIINGYIDNIKDFDEKKELKKYINEIYTIGVNEL